MEIINEQKLGSNCRSSLLNRSKPFGRPCQYGMLREVQSSFNSCAKGVFLGLKCVLAFGSLNIDYGSRRLTHRTILTSLCPIRWHCFLVLYFSFSVMQLQKAAKMFLKLFEQRVEVLWFIPPGFPIINKYGKP